MTKSYLSTLLQMRLLVGYLGERAQFAGHRNFKRPRFGQKRETARNGLGAGLRAGLRWHEMPGLGERAVALCGLGRSMSVLKGWIRPRPEG